MLAWGVGDDSVVGTEAYRRLMPNPIGAPPHTPATPVRRVSSEHLWFNVYRDVNRQFRWRLIAGNNKRIATSGEGYRNLADCEHAINLVAGTDGQPIIYNPGIRR